MCGDAVGLGVAMIDEREAIDDVELHLLNEWHLRCARERRQERVRRQVEQLVQGRRQPSELRYLLTSAVLMVLSVVILYWG